MSYDDFQKGLMAKDIAKMRVELVFSDKKTDQGCKFYEKEFFPREDTYKDINKTIAYLDSFRDFWKSNEGLEDPETGVPYNRYYGLSKVYVHLITYEHAYVTISADFIHRPSWSFLIKNTFAQMGS